MKFFHLCALKYKEDNLIVPVLQHFHPIYVKVAVSALKKFPVCKGEMNLEALLRFSVYHLVSYWALNEMIKISSLLDGKLNGTLIIFSFFYS